MNNLLRDIQDIKRFDEILKVFFEQGFDYWIYKINLHHRIKSKKKINKKNPTPKRLRKAFERLGPTFIKFGQILSVRPDLIPKEYIKELSKLQESTNPINFSVVKQVIEQETGKKINQIFSEFDKKPIASASIAQVHKAKLKNGKQVAIKVQKPGIKKLIFKDFDILFFIARSLDSFIPKFRRMNSIAMIKEFIEWTRRELDFRIEASSINRFKENMKELPVIIPKIYSKYTTKKLIVMDFIEGKPITEHKFKNKKEKLEFVKMLADIFGDMLFKFGFFHGDPHPGNIFISKNKKVIFLDFGITGELNKKLRDNICSLLGDIVNKKTEKILNKVIKFTTTTENTDIKKFKEESRITLEDWYDKKIGESSVVMAFYEIISIARRNGAILPSNIVLLVKALIDYEGIAMKICPDVDVETLFKPVVNKILYEKYNPINMLKKIEREIMDNKDFYLDFPENVTKMMKKIEKGKFDLHLEDKQLKDIENHIDNNNFQKVITKIIITLIIISPIFFLVKNATLLDMNLGYFTLILASILIFFKLKNK